MRTSIDIPDDVLDQVRQRLKAQGRTLREAVIEGLRRTVLAEPAAVRFELRDASFRGEVGFGEGFSADDLTRAVIDDGDVRLDAGSPDAREP